MEGAGLAQSGEFGIRRGGSGVFHDRSVSICKYKYAYSIMAVKRKSAVLIDFICINNRVMSNVITSKAANII